MSSELQLSNVIGQGTFGQVYVVRNGQNPLAVKAVKKSSNQKPEEMRREIEAGKMLRHKGIVQTLDSYEDDEHWYLVMEYIQGENLIDFVQRMQAENIEGELRLSHNFIKKIFTQLVKAIAYCHKHGVAHLDLKLENIMITEKTVKLLDFGLCMISEDITSCQMTRFAGSIDYIAPEILEKGSYRADKADVWSLGTILFILFTGRFPFRRRDREEFLSKNKEHPQIRSAPNIPKLAQDLIENMMKIDPNERITMAQVKKHTWLSRWSL